MNVTKSENEVTRGKRALADAIRIFSGRTVRRVTGGHLFIMAYLEYRMHWSNVRLCYDRFWRQPGFVDFKIMTKLTLNYRNRLAISNKIIVR